MDAYEPKELPERNPVTYERHRKEVMWQILAPVIIGAVIILALAILAATRTDAQVSKGADVSVIWMITPMLIVAWASCPVTPVWCRITLMHFGYR
jgi:heme/copper-type cytochrome/quinol oxidase subunit 2